MSKNKKRESKGESISFFNWFVTLIFSILPGVNILFFIITIAGARRQAKRSFAVAGLVLTLILGIAAAVMLYWFSDVIVDFLNDLIEKAPK